MLVRSTRKIAMPGQAGDLGLPGSITCPPPAPPGAGGGGSADGAHAGHCYVLPGSGPTPGGPGESGPGTTVSICYPP